MSSTQQNMRISNICLFLESKWNTEIAYKCESCLEHAFYCALQNRDGYVSDEDLVATSRKNMKLTARKINKSNKIDLMN